MRVTPLALSQDGTKVISSSWRCSGQIRDAVYEEGRCGLPSRPPQNTCRCRGTRFRTFQVRFATSDRSAMCSYRPNGRRAYETGIIMLGPPGPAPGGKRGGSRALRRGTRGAFAPMFLVKLATRRSVRQGGVAITLEADASTQGSLLSGSKSECSGTPAFAPVPGEGRPS